MKTLHGKRHMRARKSMLAGRDKKRYKKINFMIKQLTPVVKIIVPNAVEAVNEMVKAINRIINAVAQIRIVR